MLHATSGQKQVVVSRVNFLRIASSETLGQDPEMLRQQQGKDMNIGLFSISNLMRDLSTSPQGDFANYTESCETMLTRDIFGGNSLCVGFFTLQKSDGIGSTQTLRALHKCQGINNFPIQNDNRVLGLLRKYRVEIQALQQTVSGMGGGFIGANVEAGGSRLAEVERKMVDQNINILKANDERDKLIVRLKEIKDKFNDVVREKAEL